MLSKEALQIITDEITRCAHEVLGDKLKNVILYGSYARGDYKEYSDIDFMVLGDVEEKDTYRLREKIRSITSDINLDYNIIISIKLHNKSFFDSWMPYMPFYTNIINDGIELYAR